MLFYYLWLYKGQTIRLRVCILQLYSQTLPLVVSTADFTGDMKSGNASETTTKNDLLAVT